MSTAKLHKLRLEPADRFKPALAFWDQEQSFPRRQDAGHSLWLPANLAQGYFERHVSRCEKLSAATGTGIQGLSGHLGCPSPLDTATHLHPTSTLEQSPQPYSEPSAASSTGAQREPGTPRAAPSAKDRTVKRSAIQAFATRHRVQTLAGTRYQNWVLTTGPFRSYYSKVPQFATQLRIEEQTVGPAGHSWLSNPQDPIAKPPRRPAPSRIAESRQASPRRIVHGISPCALRGRFG